MQANRQAVRPMARLQRATASRRNSRHRRSRLKNPLGVILGRTPEMPALISSGSGERAAQDHAERILQIVSDGAENFVLEAVGALQPQPLGGRLRLACISARCAGRTRSSSCVLASCSC